MARSAPDNGGLFGPDLCGVSRLTQVANSVTVPSEEMTPPPRSDVQARLPSDEMTVGSRPTGMVRTKDPAG